MGKMGCALLVVVFLVLAFFSALSVTFSEGNPYGLVFAGIIGYVLYILVIKPIYEGATENKQSNTPPTSRNRPSYTSSKSPYSSVEVSSEDENDVLEFMMMEDLTDHWDDK